MLVILLKSGTLFKFAQVVILSGMKFLFAPPLSIELGFNYFQTVGVTTAGGILGVFFFYHLSGFLRILFRKVKEKIRIVLSTGKDRELLQHQIAAGKPIANKKIFNWRNRFLIKFRRTYGLFGIVALTPVLLSIPIGSFLANKYYSKDKNILMYLTISVACWSFIVSSLYFFAF